MVTAQFQINALIAGERHTISGDAAVAEIRRGQAGVVVGSPLPGITQALPASALLVNVKVVELVRALRRAVPFVRMGGAMTAALAVNGMPVIASLGGEIFCAHAHAGLTGGLREIKLPAEDVGRHDNLVVSAWPSSKTPAAMWLRPFVLNARSEVQFRRRTAGRARCGTHQDKPIAERAGLYRQRMNAVGRIGDGQDVGVDVVGDRAPSLP